MLARRNVLFSCAASALLASCETWRYYVLNSVSIEDVSEVNKSIESFQEDFGIDAIDQEVVSVYSYYIVTNSISDQDLDQFTIEDLELYTDAIRSLVGQIARRESEVTDKPVFAERSHVTLYVGPALKRSIISEIENNESDVQREKLVVVYNRLFPDE